MANATRPRAVDARATGTPQEYAAWAKEQKRRQDAEEVKERAAYILKRKKEQQRQERKKKSLARLARRAREIDKASKPKKTIVKGLGSYGRTQKARQPPPDGGGDDLAAKLAKAEAKILRLERVLGRVEDAAKFCGADKGFDLHWLGRRDVHEVLEAGSVHPSYHAVVQILKAHPKEAEAIANGDTWETGFWSGVCATGRLIGDLGSTLTAKDEHTEKTLAKQVWEEFPLLDS